MLCLGSKGSRNFLVVEQSLPLAIFISLLHIFKLCAGDVDKVIRFDLLLDFSTYICHLPHRCF